VLLAELLSTLRSKALQCDSLVTNAHRNDSSGKPLFPDTDRQLITVAAFLNLFIAWEEFLEAALGELMSGAPTLSGTSPTKYVSPPDATKARAIVVGVNRFFDYANQEYVRKIVSTYFEHGYPFEPHLSAIASDLADLRTMRNASAHLSSTTRAALEALAQRIFSTPRPGIDLYTLLTTPDPRSESGNTVLAEARDKLLAAAELIVSG
jgi:hypothetical protein